MLHASIPHPYTYTILSQTPFDFSGFIHFCALKEDSYRSRKPDWEAPAHRGAKKKKALFFTNEEKRHKGCAFEAASIHLSFTQNAPHLFI